MRFARGCLIFTVVMAVWLAAVPKAAANNIAFFQTVAGTDWVTAGVGGMRNTAGPTSSPSVEFPAR